MHYSNHCATSGNLLESDPGVHLALLGGLLVIPAEADLVELHETLAMREDVVPLTVA